MKFWAYIIKCRFQYDIMLVVYDTQKAFSTFYSRNDFTTPGPLIEWEEQTIL